MDECINCGAPGGYPYCSEGCRAADNPDDYDDTGPEQEAALR